MIIERIDRNEYDGLIKNYNANVYNESAFIELNSNKVDNIYYLVAKLRIIFLICTVKFLTSIR